jgi:hypothetical protein
MMFIEKHIAIPPRISNVVDQMEAGDSVLFRNEIEALRMRDAMRYRDIKYTMRKVARIGWRVWRLS